MSFRRALLLVAVPGLLFLAAMLAATGGRPALPLDDSFIYFQYARETAAGHPFSYQPGDAPTTGATSVPWMLMLAAGPLLGFDGKAMIFLAMILCGLFFAATVRWAGRAETALATDETGPGGGPGTAWPFAAVLVALSGPLNWGAWSGMEIAYFSAMIAWTFAEYARSGGEPTRRSALASAFLATARPEGALLVAAAAALHVAGAVFRADRRRALVWALAPALLVLAQPALNLLLTGETRSSGFLAKTLLARPGADLTDALRQVLLRGTSLGAALLGGVAPFADARGLYAYESEGASLWVAPGAGLLFLLGVLPGIAREARDRAPGAHTLAVAWIATIVYGTCLLDEPDAHFSRYQMPLLPLFLVGVAAGVARIARALAGAAGGLGALAAGIRGWLVAAGIVSVVFHAGAYADNCQDIDRMQIRMGESLASLPPESVIAINDAGAIAYFSGRRTLDLVGLTSPGWAGLWPQGSGVLWEKLESLPEAERPGWFCFFPNWFDFDGIGLVRRVGSVRRLAPSIVDAEKVLGRADWSLAGSGDLPRRGRGPGAPPRVVDRLDVADTASEAAHAFRWTQGERGADAGSFLLRAGFVDAPGDEIVDAGRTILESLEFRVARDPRADAALVVRTAAGVRQRVLVSVDGGAEQPLEIYAPGGGLFHEQVVTPLGAGAEPAHVRIRVVEDPAGSAPLIPVHYFVLAEPAG